MAVTSACPDSNLLQELAGNRLPSEQAETLRAHMAACTQCRGRLTDTTNPGRDDPTVLRAQGSAQALLSPPRGPGELGWLGEYRVVGVLGEGGMAVVFDAEEPRLCRSVALKVLRADGNDAAARERFLREARVVASLNNERIVQVFAVGEANGVPFLAMEKLQGETLARRLERDRWLPVADALGVAREVAEGLAALHERGLIHRDIKPDNLWLEANADGRVSRVKLIDLGIARHIEGDPALTNPGQLIGTPNYMAPEQAAGEPIDARTDLYALGCVLYRMVSGRTPFEAARPNTLAVLSAVLRNEVTPIEKVVPSLSQPVVELIHDLMEREPARRPASAAELAGRLRHLEHEERSTTSRTKMIQARAGVSPGRQPRRAPAWSIAVGATALLTALAVGAGGLYHKYGRMVAGTAPPAAVTPAEALTPPAPAGEVRPPIKVGVLFSRTDVCAVHELPLLEAVQLAIEEINETGGVLGRPLEPVLADGASREELFARRAVGLIDDHHVAAIFGCWSSGARRTVAQVCGAPPRDCLLFYPGHHEGVEDFNSVVYLGGAPNQLLVPLVKYAYADLRKRRVFFIGNESINSLVLGEILSHEARQLEAQVVGTAYLPPGDVTLKPVVERIADTKADLVVSALAGTDNVALFRAMRAARLAPPAVTTAWLHLKPAELFHFAPTLAGDLVAGCYLDSQPSPANEAFVERYRKRHGADRRISDTMAAAYNSVFLWKQAVEKAGSLRTWDVRVALRGLTADTPAGPLKIDPVTLHAWHTGLVCRVTDDDGRLAFRAVHQTPGPIEPVFYPRWRTTAQWQEFIDKHHRQWGSRWDSSR